jgi:hypothetical protein
LMSRVLRLGGCGRIAARHCSSRHSGQVSQWGILDDVEADARALAAADIDAEVDDRARAEFAAVTFADRLRSGVGAAVTVSTLDATWRGRLDDVGVDVVVLGGLRGENRMIPVEHITVVSGLPRELTPRRSDAAYLTFRRALDHLARDQTRVRLEGPGVPVGDVRIERVGADHLDLAGGGVSRSAQPGGARFTVALKLVRAIALPVGALW